MKKRNPSDERRPPDGGFTLIELIIATTIGAMLLVAVAEVAQLFGKQVEVVRDESDWRLEEALVRLADDSKRAWIVEQPTPASLQLTDAYGNATTFEYDDKNATLVVHRPTGESGDVLTDVQDFSVDTRTMLRYREATPLDEYATWWADTSTLGAEAEAIPVEDGMPLALGFTLSTTAPASVSTVEGVTEQNLQATLERIVLPLAFLPPIKEPLTEVEDTGPKEPLEDMKYDLCHVPPGNTGNATTLIIPDDSVQAHLDHGDYMGICKTVPVVPDWNDTIVYVDLYEATAPDDARPYGPLIASTGIPATALPTGSYSWTEKALTTPATQGGGAGGEGMAVCHIPPSTPFMSHTLNLAPGIVDEHLSHGDVLGSCDTSLDEDDTVVLDLHVPTTSVPLDLVGLNTIVEPGRAYTLVFRVAGSGIALFAGQPLGTDKNTGLAALHVTGGSYSKLDLTVPRSIDGMRTSTQTDAIDVISGVTLTLQTVDGDRQTASATIASQVSVDNPWLGCVPGEYPGLELAGQ